MDTKPNKASLPQHGITKEEWEQFHDLWAKIEPLYRAIYNLKSKVNKGAAHDSVIISSSRHQTGPRESITGPRIDSEWNEIYADEENEVIFTDLEFPAETEMTLRRKIADNERKYSEQMEQRRRQEYERLKAEFEGK